MSEHICDGDVDVQAIRDRCDIHDVEDALEQTNELIFKLIGLRDNKPENERAHEVLRALSLVRFALEDALDEE